MAIAFFFAIWTGLGGAVGPGLFGKLIESGDRGQAEPLSAEEAARA